jgi:release factor glutamine methyltransferase
VTPRRPVAEGSPVAGAVRWREQFGGGSSSVTGGSPVTERSPVGDGSPVGDESFRSLVRAVAARIDAAGVPSPLADAIALVGHASGLGTSEVRLRMARGDAISDGLVRGGLGPDGLVPGGLDRAALEAAVARRAAREPLQHILGLAAFRTLSLEVGPGVFVPRPETEVVAGRAIRAAAAVARRGDVPSCADLCAGSGAIGISIAAEVPTARVSLIELDSAAFAYLARNIARQQPDVRERLEAARADARTALGARDGTLDVVVSNPPYIPPGATPRDAEVADHDPAVALFGLGADGLEVPRGIVAAAARLLRPGGTFVMEHGDEQGAAVRTMLEVAMVEGARAWTGIETCTDHTGRERFVVASRA